MNKQELAEQILEGNKLIAEFVGYKQHNHGSYKTFEIDGRHIYESVVQYNTKWEWLMPVVEKIESMGTIIEIWLSLGKGCRITKGSFKDPIKTIATTESNSTIEAVWLAVIEFIKWYRPELANNQNLNQ
jgi:hypothetical protein